MMLIVASVVAVSGLAILVDNSVQAITPIEDFPVISIGNPPFIDPSTYVLSVSGMVQHNLSLTLDQIKALPAVTEVEALRCVSGPSGVAEWTGVVLKTVLDMAGVDPDSTHVVFYSADGYSTDLTISESLASDVLICYQMDGVPLPPEHGFPVRIIVPNHWGYKWAKWVVSIQVIDHEYKGFWESRGWSDNATIAAPVDWYYHSIILTSAGVVGGFAGISGVINGRRKRADRPYFLDPKLHRYLGYAFTIIVTIVFLWWSLQTLTYRGSVFYTFHGRLGLAAVALEFFGMLAGMSLGKSNENMRWWHSILTNSGYLIFLIAIAAGAMLAY